MKLDGQLRHLLDVVEGGGAPVTGGARERFADLQQEWAANRKVLDGISADQIGAINRWAEQRAIPQVAAP